LPDAGDETTLMKLLNDIEVPPADPAREAALLAAFDAYHARSRQRFGFPAWAAAAALVVITVSLNWLVVTRPAPAPPRVPDASFDLTGFVAWPGASAWPPLESGSLMRVDLPVSLLPTLGLSAPSSAAGFVAADIVVGQDGFARAVRLVQQQ
jgi:hypothetical protein